MVNHLLATQFNDIEWEPGEKGERHFKEFLCQLREKCEKAKRVLGTETSVRSHFAPQHAGLKQPDS